MDPTQRNSPVVRVRRYGRTWLWAEYAVMAFGVICLLTWGALYIDGLTGARHELERFADLKRAGPLATAHRT